MGVRRRRNFFTSGAWLRVFVERVVLVGSILLAFGLQACSSTVQSDDVPQFQVDPTWPSQLPNQWIIGAVAGVAVDSRDHVWIVHRPSTLQPNELRSE